MATKKRVREFWGSVSLKMLSYFLKSCMLFWHALVGLEVAHALVHALAHAPMLLEVAYALVHAPRRLN